MTMRMGSLMAALLALALSTGQAPAQGRPKPPETPPTRTVKPPPKAPPRTVKPAPARKPAGEPELKRRKPRKPGS